MNEEMQGSQTSVQPTKRIGRRIAMGGIVLGVIFVLMQLTRFVVPALALENPPVERTINWDSAETQRLWEQSCADCHSNETIYPWYANVAPVSWLVVRDIEEGRDHLNISVPGRIDVNEMVEVIDEGEMPMPIYTITHPEARLDDAERQALMAGLQATFNDPSNRD